MVGGREQQEGPAVLVSGPLQSDTYFVDVLANVYLFLGQPGLLPPTPSVGSFEQALLRLG